MTWQLSGHAEEEKADLTSVVRSLRKCDPDVVNRRMSLKGGVLHKDDFMGQ